MEDEAKRKAEKPVVDAAAATELAARLYGLDVVGGTIKELDSYDDRNFYFRARVPPSDTDDAKGDDANSDGAGAFHFVLKVHNGVESLALPFIEAQNQAMERVRGAGIWSPRALPSVRDAQIETAERALASGELRKHAVRLLPFRPARLLGDVAPSLELLRRLGSCAAAVTAALTGFEHPATERVFMWDLAQAADIKALLHHLPIDRRACVEGVLADFDGVVLPLAPQLRRAVIHGDLNDQNVLVGADGVSVLGVIDFGDMMNTWLVNELAITAAYVLIMMEYEREGAGAEVAPPPAEALAAVVGSYTQRIALNDDEWSCATRTPTRASSPPARHTEASLSARPHTSPIRAAASRRSLRCRRTILPILISCRIAVSLTVGAYSSSKDPDNEYLKLTLLPGWKVGRSGCRPLTSRPRVLTSAPRAWQALKRMRAVSPAEWASLLRAVPRESSL